MGKKHKFFGIPLPKKAGQFALFALCVMGIVCGIWALQEGQNNVLTPYSCTQSTAVFLPPEGKVNTEGTQKSTQVAFVAEVAKTPQQKQMGLMFRKYLPANAGMFFEWPYPRQIHMWMKNTFIPLDMVFINKGIVVGIIKAEKTQSEAILTLPTYADGVFEINLGVSKQHGITPGWRFKLEECF